MSDIKKITISIGSQNKDPSIKIEKGTPDFEDIKQLSTKKQREWIINQCPKVLKKPFSLLIENSELDRSNLLLPHLYFQVNLAKHALDKPTKKEFYSKIEDVKSTNISWKEFIKSPTGITLGIVILLLILNLLK